MITARPWRGVGGGQCHRAHEHQGTAGSGRPVADPCVYEYREGRCSIVGADGDVVLSLDSYEPEIGDDDFDYILRAVNCHGELVAALKTAESALAKLHDGFGPLRGHRNAALTAVRAALDKARP